MSLVFDGDSSVSVSTVSGNPRILGDFSNSTIASRVAFQTSTTNANTVVTAIPNGTATTTSLQLYNNSTPTNAAGLQLFAYASEVRVASGITGTGTYNPLTFHTGGVERVRIDAAGNVSVGLNNGTSKLNVYSSNGGAPLTSGSGDTSAVASFINGVISLEIGHYVDGTAWIQNRTFNDYTGNYNIVMQPNGGAVTVGTNPTWTGKFTVNQTAAGNVARFFLNAANTLANHCVVFDKYDNNNTTSQVFLGFTNNNQNNANGQINGNGAGQAAFGAWSDRRLKENIVDLPSQLNQIASLRPVEFDYKDGSGHQIGFIAQEVQEIYPDAVGENSDGYLTVTGWSKTEARLIKAIQELKAELDNAKERIAVLENK